MDIEKIESIGKLVSIIYRYTHIYLDKELKEFNIGAGQIPILSMLYRYKNLTQKDLSEQFKIDKANITRSIKKLEHENYIKRRKNPNDSRYYVLSLTKKSMDLKPKLMDKLRALSNLISKDFTEEEYNLAITLLRKMAKNSQSCVDE